MMYGSNGLPASFDNWLTTEPERLCEECGSPDECRDDCPCSDCEEERALDEDADAIEERARDYQP